MAAGKQGWLTCCRIEDMVWGKVKSHPWWPGHIYNEAFADEGVCRDGRREGRETLVAFYGDSSYGWFDHSELLQFDAHFPQLANHPNVRNFSAAIAEAVDELARRGALAVMCPCRYPAAFRPRAPGYVTVDVPGYERDAHYPDWLIADSRAKFQPEEVLVFVQMAAVLPMEVAAETHGSVRGIQIAALLVAYRRTRYEERDVTYAEAFGVDPARAAATEEQTTVATTRAAPLAGKQKTPQELGRKRRRGAKDVAKGAPATKDKASKNKVSKNSSGKASSSKNDQYVLKRREDARGAALPAPASMPESAHRPGALPDLYLTAAGTPAVDQSPPGFSADPQTPPLPGSDDDFMLQRRAPPPAAAPAALPAACQGSEGAVPMDAPPKKANKEKKARKREREEPADATAAGEAKKKKKKKKLAELDGTAAFAASGGGKPPGEDKSGGATPPLPKLDMDTLDLKQVTADLQDLALDPFEAAARLASDTALVFLLAFRSKFYQKSLANALPGEFDTADARGKPNAEMTAGQPSTRLKPAKKKKQIVRPDDPTKSGKKRLLSDRQEEMAVKKKSRLDKIKTMATDKKAGPEQKDTGVPSSTATPAAAVAQQPRTGNKEKSETVAKKKEPAAPAKMPSPTALMMKFPLKSTLPSVASLKARFARFGQLDLDGIRVYWKSHMCRVIYKFRSDAQIALNYARNNDMFGQVKAHYYLREVESSTGEPQADAAPQRTDQRSSEIAAFRPGSSGNASGVSTLAQPRTTMPARTTVGQPKSILKKTNDDGGSTAGGALRDVPRVKFMLDGGDSKVEQPPMPVTGTASGIASQDTSTAKAAKTVGFMPPTLQPPARAAPPPFHPPARPPTMQPVPSPPPQSLPYPPRPADMLLSAPPQRMIGGNARAEPQLPSLRAGFAGGNGKPADISAQMLKLLLQCNEVVNFVKGSLGYVPYHPI